MKIAVLGTFLKDRIIDLQGRVTESKGGLFYSIEALRAICNKDDEIIPLSRVGKDFHQEVVSHFKDDKRVRLDGLFPHNGLNNCVELRYLTPEKREERSLNPMPPLTAEQLTAFLKVDVFITNFISGWEIELNAFRTFSARYDGLSAMDIHSLTLARLENGLRRLQKVANIGQWIEPVTIVQCNDTEFKMISDVDLQQFYKMFCYDQQKIVNLTSGKHGSLHVYRVGDDIKTVTIQPERRVNVVDPTGCGDVFLAGFVYFFASGSNVVRAAQKAATLSALSGSVKGLPEVEWLRNAFNKIVG